MNSKYSWLLEQVILKRKQNICIENRTDPNIKNNCKNILLTYIVNFQKMAITCLGYKITGNDFVKRILGCPIFTQRICSGCLRQVYMS